MDEDFAVLDFALVGLTNLAVAEALQRARQGGVASAAGQDDDPAPRGGFLSRLFGGKSKAKAPAAVTLPGLSVQPQSSLPPGPITRLVLDDMGFGEDKDPLRLSYPIGTPAMTLIEFRNHADTGPAEVLMQLSGALPGVEVLGFRYSGTRHPGADFSFAVYRDGALARMRVSRSPEGMEEAAEWSAVDHGTPHPLEASLPDASESRAYGVMTPDMQGELLDALQIEPEKMFGPEASYTSQLVLADGPGTPLEDLLAKGAAPAATAPAAAAQPAPAPEANEGWEEEITSLLVGAVEDALPPEDHVPWLNDLTAQLEDGDVDGAMIKARALINQGGRTSAERKASVERLEQLFAIRGG